MTGPCFELRTVTARANVSGFSYPEAKHTVPVKSFIAATIAAFMLVGTTAATDTITFNITFLQTMPGGTFNNGIGPQVDPTPVPSMASTTARAASTSGSKSVVAFDPTCPNDDAPVCGSDGVTTATHASQMLPAATTQTRESRRRRMDRASL
ncbi:unnamed protein product [Phytophthora lilii]|uniref:Unnamed protein product n=1 Tax=Phytophthora lilii TaxID=2077276 RepID=A0A9W6TXY4_9STRA|nr:unnamed protein product [Phytophthora lilii]